MDSGSEDIPPLNQPVSVPTPDQPQSVQDVLPRPPEASKPHLSGHGTVSQVRDTLETVLLALILAFSFRTFCVEAMVIPTGSLAPTLDGAHFRVIDPKSGYTFDIDANVNIQWINNRFVNFNGNGELGDPFAIAAPGYIICPNDSEPIPVNELPDPKVVRFYQADNKEYTFPYAYNGDRVLVQKYLYWLSPPQRWDIAVFREPKSGQTNYIKRLVGLPGETVEIVDGNVFINGNIARKPVDVQEAMLQNVYNNDFYPMDAGQVRADGSVWNSPWTSVSDTEFSGRWSTNSSTIRYVAASASGQGRLSFTNAEYLQNFTGYNQEPFPLPDYEHQYVGDLCLHAVVNFLGSFQSAVAITLGQPANCYQVRLNHNGTMGLYKLSMDKQSYDLVPIDKIALNKTVQPLDSSQTLGVTMSNIDHEIRFWVNDNLVLDYQIPWTVDAAKSYVHNLQANPSLQIPLIYLDVTGDCTLRHLILMRDIYYTQTPAPATGTMDNPITLHAKEYFMLGDNTNDSEDSRLWNQVEPVLQSDLQLRQGVVPQRYMIGRAFMVYWPAGFRPVSGINWPIIPNVGHIRLVR